MKRYTVIEHPYTLFIDKVGFKMYLCPGPMSIIDNGYVDYAVNIQHNILSIFTEKEKIEHLEYMTELGKRIDSGNIRWFTPSGYQLGFIFDKDGDETILRVIARPSNAVGYSFILKRHRFKGWDVDTQISYLERWFTGKSLKKFMNIINGRTFYKE